MYQRSRGMSSEVFASRVWPEAQSCVLVRVPLSQREIVHLDSYLI